MGDRKKACYVSLAVICDDVRLESDGRYSLMGVLGGNLTLTTDDPEAGDPEFTYSMFFETVSVQNCQLSFRLRNLETDDVILEFEGLLEHKGETGVAEFGGFSMYPQTFSLPRSGVYQLQYSVDDCEWTTCKEFMVTIDRPDA